MTTSDEVHEPINRTTAITSNNNGNVVRQQPEKSPTSRARSLTVPSVRNRDLNRTSLRALMRQSLETADEESNSSSPTGGPSVPSKRLGSLDNCISAFPLPIPTFTVTINPMEDNEITFVPDIPSAESPEPKREPELTISAPSQCTITIPPETPATTTLSTLALPPINHQHHNETTKIAITAPIPSEEELRRSSIGSASSLAMEPSENFLNIPRDLQIRRVSEISHIKELRQAGMDHLGSEYYEISRESNPDNISLDSIHQTIFKRCQNKYMPPEQSSMQNKCFVIVTTVLTIAGMAFGFWYKNFGPGSVPHDQHHAFE